MKSLPRLAVSRHPLGKRVCSPAHAGTCACNLYRALHVCQRHNAARHGGRLLVLATSSPDCHASGASKGRQKAMSATARGPHCAAWPLHVQNAWHQARGASFMRLTFEIRPVRLRGGLAQASERPVDYTV